ncbi:thioredoxin [Halorubrum vacuolatum]|uniref:Thioredoxin n=1 Tax=Halorubrum vacuolatum TaxID=63740 RepID=A0A238UTX4_HALVU|nr:thioredoxin [Halorubrum vacuolatum]SNR25640.1 thioredoxin [Halorubrum vacuolatum]
MSSSTDAAPSEYIELESEDLFEDLLDDHDVVLVDFYADWCGPCKMMEPTIESLAAGTAAAVVKVNVDHFQGLASRFGVRGIPTILLFADGEQVERAVGVQSEADLSSMIADHTA